MGGCGIRELNIEIRSYVRTLITYYLLLITYYLLLITYYLRAIYFSVLYDRSNIIVCFHKNICLVK